jgi:hypothetical protein
MLILAALPALAAPAGYKETQTTENCSLYLGPAAANGVVPMHAECTWKGVDLAKLDAFFSRWEEHATVFSTIVSSTVEGTEGTSAIVRQVHHSKGISDRECVLKMDKTTIAGGFRYAWTLHGPAPTVAEGHVPVAFDDGYWEFTAVDGGVRAVHHLEYDPGGSVPSFLVRWFQTSGLETIVHEIEAYARAH